MISVLVRALVWARGKSEILAVDAEAGAGSDSVDCGGVADGGGAATALSGGTGDAGSGSGILAGSRWK